MALGRQTALFVRRVKIFRWIIHVIFLQLHIYQCCPQHLPLFTLRWNKWKWNEAHGIFLIYMSWICLWAMNVTNTHIRSVLNVIMSCEWFLEHVSQTSWMLEQYGWCVFGCGDIQVCVVDSRCSSPGVCVVLRAYLCRCVWWIQGVPLQVCVWCWGHTCTGVCVCVVLRGTYAGVCGGFKVYLSRCVCGVETYQCRCVWLCSVYQCSCVCVLLCVSVQVCVWLCVPVQVCVVVCTCAGVCVVV